MDLRIDRNKMAKGTMRERLTRSVYDK